MNETFPTIVVVGGAVSIGVAVPRGLATPTLAVARVRVPCNQCMIDLQILGTFPRPGR